MFRPCEHHFPRKDFSAVDIVCGQQVFGMG
jgi:hypothetical protein